MSDMKKRWMDRYFGRHLRLQDRLFYIFCIVGIFCSFMAFLAAMFSNLPLISVQASFGCFIVMFLLAVYSFWSRNTRRGGIAICLGLNLVLFPILFCVTGGLNSGMILYFILGICVSSVVLEGRARLAVLLVSMAEYTMLIAASFSHPWIIVPIEEEAVLPDTLSSFFIVAVFICTVIVVLVKEYSKKNNSVIALNEELKRQSMSDALTKLYNRRYLMSYLEELRAGSQGTELLCVAMFDLDGFKKVNDQYGHLCGDAVLARFGVILKEETSEPAFGVRYGGEEFLAVLPGYTVERAKDYAERIRLRVKNDGDLIQLTGGITISGGVSRYSSENSGDNLICDVDKKLYEAKRIGKDRIIV